MARSRSGTRGRRGPRKPPRRDGAFNGAGVQTLDPRERGPIELPATITVDMVCRSTNVTLRLDTASARQFLATQASYPLP